MLIIRYFASNNEIYLRWSHSIDTSKLKQKQKTISCKFTENDKWSNEIPQKIHDFLIKLRYFKNKDNILPINIWFNFTFSEFCSLKPYELTLELKKNLSQKSKYIQICNKGNADLTINITNKSISAIAFENLAGSFLHSIDQIKYNNKEEFIGDIFIAISLVLMKLNKNYNAIEILNIFCKQSKSIKLPKVALNFTQLYFSMGKIKKAKELWNNINEIEKDDIDKDIFFIQLVKFGNINEKHLLMDIKRDNKNSTKYYNYANFLKNKKELRQAIKMYNKALKLNKNHYSKAEYFYSEIGGILFELEKYKWSSNYYKKSLELKYIVSNEALYADALMLAGQYELAKKNFENYHEKIYICKNEYNSEWLLKKVFLKYLINEHDIKSQIRKRKEIIKNDIYKKCGKKEVSIQELEDTLRLDALDPLISFNLGVMYSKKEQCEDSMVRFLICALMDKNDIEAWLNTIVQAFNAKKISLIPHICSVAYFYNKIEFEKELLALFNQLNLPQKLIHDLQSSLFENINNAKNEDPIIRLL